MYEIGQEIVTSYTDSPVSASRRYAVGQIVDITDSETQTHLARFRVFETDDTIIKGVIVSVGLHKCEPGYHLVKDRFVFQSRGYGAAVESCVEDTEGRLWCDNSEYGTQVNFCPFCGYKAPQQVTV